MRVFLLATVLLWIVPNLMSQLLSPSCQASAPPDLAKCGDGNGWILFAFFAITLVSGFFYAKGLNGLNEEIYAALKGWHETLSRLLAKLNPSGPVVGDIERQGSASRYLVIIFLGFVLLVLIPVLTSWMADGFGEWHRDWYGLKYPLTCVLLLTILNEFVMGFSRVVVPEVSFSKKVSWGLEKHRFVNLVFFSLTNKWTYEVRDIPNGNGPIEQWVTVNLDVMSDGMPCREGVLMSDFIELLLKGKTAFIAEHIANPLKRLKLWEDGTHEVTQTRPEELSGLVKSLSNPNSWMSLLDVVFGFREGEAGGRLNLVFPESDSDVMAMHVAFTHLDTIIRELRSAFAHIDWTINWLLDDQSEIGDCMPLCSSVVQTKTIRGIPIDRFEVVRRLVNRHVEFISTERNFYLIINTKPGTKNTSIASALSSLNSKNAAVRVSTEPVNMASGDPGKELFVEASVRLPSFI